MQDHIYMYKHKYIYIIQTSYYSYYYYDQSCAPQSGATTLPKCSQMICHMHIGLEFNRALRG